MSDLDRPLPATDADLVDRRPPVTTDSAPLSIVTRQPLAGLAEQASDYVRQSRPPNTRRAYQSDWTRFEAWCWSQAVNVLPVLPAVLALYLTAHATTHRTSSLARWLTSIGQAHRAAGHDDPSKAPEVRAVWKGIRRVRRTAPVGKMPVRVSVLRRMVDTLPDTLRGHRDRALILLGFAGAFRRSELVGLDVADVLETTDGLVVTVRQSKTDQAGQGHTVGIPYGSHRATCPVRAVRSWREAAGISAGPLFRAVNLHNQVRPDG